MPAAIYADKLKSFGVDADPEELIRRATLAYADLQGEMRALAPLVAREKGYDADDYRDVIRALKQERVAGDRVVDFYKQILGELERAGRSRLPAALGRAACRPPRGHGARVAPPAPRRACAHGAGDLPTREGLAAGAARARGGTMGP